MSFSPIKALGADGVKSPTRMICLLQRRFWHTAVSLFKSVITSRRFFGRRPGSSGGALPLTHARAGARTARKRISGLAVGHVV